MDKADRCFFWVSVTMASVFSFLIGVGCGKDYERQKAIEANVGQWTVEEKTGKVEFVYGVKNEKQ